jgi:hypothetical protein
VRIVSTKDNRTANRNLGARRVLRGRRESGLTGGQPLFVDSLKGRTTGRELTWWANNDRLLVNGEEQKPAESTIIRKKK